MNTSRLALAITILLPAGPAAAAELPPSIRLSAACAPVGAHPVSDAPRIDAVGPQEKTLYYAGEQVVVDAGTARGLEVAS